MSKGKVRVIVFLTLLFSLALVFLALAIVPGGVPIGQSRFRLGPLREWLRPTTTGYSVSSSSTAPVQLWEEKRYFCIMVRTPISARMIPVGPNGFIVEIQN